MNTGTASCPPPGLSASILRAAMAAAAVALAAAGTASGSGCVGDINNDMKVDGADLGLLLGNWGGSDQLVDLTGDGIVDGADLGVLLGSWGVCEPPANDTCATAMPVTDGSYPFCGTLASSVGPSLPDGTCVTTIYNDLWFRYDATSTGVLTVSTCRGIEWLDTVVAVYGSAIPGLAACPGGVGFSTFLGCDDDGCWPHTQSQLSVDVVAGSVYLIRVGNFFWDQTYSGVLDIQMTPAGATCANPIYPTAYLHNEISGDTTGNPVTAISPCNLPGSSAPSSWVRWWCGCDGWVTATTCNPATNFDTILTVLDDGSGGACFGGVIDCNDDTQLPECLLNGAHRKSEVTFHATAGQFYYVLVSGYNGASGHFDLTIDLVCDP